MELWTIITLDIDDLEDVQLFRNEDDAVRRYMEMRSDAMADDDIVEEDTVGLSVDGATEHSFETSFGTHCYLRKVWVMS